MNIKHRITLSVLLTCAFAYTADTDTNVATHLHQSTEIISQFGSEQCSQTIDGEQNNTSEQSLSKKNIVGIALLLCVQGYVMSMPFIPEQYIVQGKWSFALPLMLIAGCLLLSDRMSDTMTDMSSYESSDSTQSEYSMHNSNLPYSLMYPQYTSTYTPTFTPIHF